MNLPAIAYHPLSVDDQVTAQADVARAKAPLAREPRIAVAEALERTCPWFTHATGIDRPEAATFHTADE